jgi:cytochrome c
MRSGYLIPAFLAAAVLLAACGGETAPAANAPDTPAAPAAPAPTLEQLPAPYNEASLDAGKQAFSKKCGSCHYLDRKKGHMVGPNLNGVFERGPAGAGNYGSYSAALKALPGETWDPAALDQWLANPRAFLPGSNMFFNGIADADERRNVIAYLMVESRK